MVDIYQAANRQGKYPPLSPTLRCKIIFGKYHAETKKLVFSPQYTVKWSEIKLLTRDFVFFGCSDVRE